MAGWLGEHDDAHGGEEREHDDLAQAPRLALRVRRQVHDFCRDSRENEVKFFVLFFVFELQKLRPTARRRQEEDDGRAQLHCSKRSKEAEMGKKERKAQRRS